MRIPATATRLPINAPPTLLSAIGYQGVKSLVAIYEQFEEIYFDDGSFSGTASHSAWGAFAVHELIGRRLLPHASKTLVIDRTDHAIYALPHHDAMAWVHATNGTITAIENRTVSLDEIIEALDMTTWEELPSPDEDTINRRIAEATRQREDMITWIDDHVPPISPAERAEAARLMRQALEHLTKGKRPSTN